MLRGRQIGQRHAANQQAYVDNYLMKEFGDLRLKYLDADRMRYSVKLPARGLSASTVNHIFSTFQVVLQGRCGKKSSRQAPYRSTSGSRQGCSWQCDDHNYLGVLTPDGLIPAHRRMLGIGEPVLSKEFGASWLLASLTGDIREHLRSRFPDIWKELYAICLARTVRPCAYRYIAQRYENSILSEALPNLALSGASITTLLKALGTRRGAISSFMKNFLQDEHDYLLFDGTGTVSFSRGMDDTQVGYNSSRIYDPQANLLYAFFAGQSGGMPAYYRKFPGSIRDVSAFKAIVTEMGMKDIVVIADKGFGSVANFTNLDGAGLQYIVPLRLNSIAYDRTPLMTADKSGFSESHFT